MRGLGRLCVNTWVMRVFLFGIMGRVCRINESVSDNILRWALIHVNSTAIEAGLGLITEGAASPAAGISLTILLKLSVRFGDVSSLAERAACPAHRALVQHVDGPGTLCVRSEAGRRRPKDA